MLHMMGGLEGYDYVEEGDWELDIMSLVGVKGMQGKARILLPKGADKRNWSGINFGGLLRGKKGGRKRMATIDLDSLTFSAEDMKKQSQQDKEIAGSGTHSHALAPRHTLNGSFISACILKRKT